MFSGLLNGAALERELLFFMGVGLLALGVRPPELLQSAIPIAFKTSFSLNLKQPLISDTRYLIPDIRNN
jgi:hypothetical protein